MVSQAFRQSVLHKPPLRKNNAWRLPTFVRPLIRVPKADARYTAAPFCAASLTVGAP
ncbi:hypothetical protein ACVI9W_003389 [Pseudomonas sp. 210_17 TE3656]